MTNVMGIEMRAPRLRSMRELIPEWGAQCPCCVQPNALGFVHACVMFPWHE
jgi:hypothetical protein